VHAVYHRITVQEHEEAAQAEQVREQLRKEALGRRSSDQHL
jgi:hypothetical protein